MADLFKDILPSLQLTKKYIFVDKDYNPFMVNKAISYYVDAIFYANEMNRYTDLPKVAQYDFYFYGLEAKRRPYTKWAKSPKQEDLELIQRYFGYNETKARDVINILTEDQLVMIRKRLTVGV